MESVMQRPRVVLPRNQGYENVDGRNPGRKNPSIYGFFFENTSQVVGNGSSEASTVGVKDQQYKRIPKENIKP